MTADPNIADLTAVIAEHLETAEPDLLRVLLPTFVRALMPADAVGSGNGTRSSERINTRHGYLPPRLGHPDRSDRAGAAQAAPGLLRPASTTSARLVSMDMRGITCVDQATRGR